MDETCFCGTKVVLSSRWPSSVLGSKPTPFGLLVGRPITVTRCLACKEPLCPIHSIEHKSTDVMFNKPPFIVKEDSSDVGNGNVIVKQQLDELDVNMERDLPCLLGEGPICRHCIRRRHDYARHRRQRLWLIRASKYITIAPLLKRETKSSMDDDGDEMEDEITDEPLSAVVDGENEFGGSQHYEFLYPQEVEEDTAIDKIGRVVDTTYKVAQYIPGIDTTVNPPLPLEC